MPTKFSDYAKELKEFEKEGYELVDRIVMDYGYTLGVVLKKGKRKYKVMLRECFYDTDSKGNRTKWHGILDIRETPWSKGL